MVDASWRLTAKLLLVQLDGKLRCISLSDGEERWCTQLPGGELIRSGHRHDAPAHGHLCLQCPTYSSCGRCRFKSGCRDIGDRNVSSVYAPVGGPIYSLAFDIECEKLEGCIVSRPHHMQATVASPPLEWYLFATPAAVNKDAVGLPLHVALERWRDRCCPLHGPIDFEHNETSYAEINLDTGRLLLSLDTGWKNPVAELNDSPVGATSLLLTVRRTDTSRTVVFPSHWRPLLSDSDSVEEATACYMWYVLSSAIDLGVLDVSTGDSTTEVLMQERLKGLRVEQTLTTTGINVYLRADETEGKTFSLKVLTSESVPVLFAHIVWLQYTTDKTSISSTQDDIETETEILKEAIKNASIDDNDSYNTVSTSRVCCQEIPVISFSAATKLNVAWQRQNHAIREEGLPAGFVSCNYRVFFFDCITPHGVELHALSLPRQENTMTTVPENVNVFSHSLDDYVDSKDEDVDEEKHKNAVYDEHVEATPLYNKDTDKVKSLSGSPSSTSSTSSSSSYHFSNDALVHHNGTKTHSSSTDGRAIVPLRMSPSFFDENFDVVLPLGRGASGAVLLTRHRVTGVFYAIKLMLIRGRSSEDALNEVRLHAMLHHKYLVRYYGCWLEEVTPCRVHQLAGIGLCDRKEAQKMCTSSAAGRLNCPTQWHCMPHIVGSGEGWCAPMSRVNSIGPQLLRAPTPPPEETVAAPIHMPLLLPPPPPDERKEEEEKKQWQHIKGTGMYMAGHDDVDSSPSCSFRTDVTGAGDALANPSRLVDSSSSSGESDGILDSQLVFLQLEYCQTTLAQRLGSRGSVDRLENIIIMSQLFSALRYVHKCGCLHRDIKPTNIFLDYRSQMANGEDMSDDDNDDDEDEEYGQGEEEASAKDGEEKKMGVASPNCNHATEITAPGLVPFFLPPSFSALEFLKANAGVGLLAIYLKRFREAKNDVMRMRAIRSVRRWLNRRLLRVRLGDFGLAKSLNDQHVDIAIFFNRSAMNTIGVGSPLYSSPEQLDGNVCTASSDAFACGVMMAEMYLQPKTVAERLFELQRVRDGVFHASNVLKKYPELQVVQGLTLKDPNSRMLLSVASRVLAKTADDILLSFLLE